MKKYIILCFLIISIKAVSQQKKIYVEYGVTIHNDQDLRKGDAYRVSLYENAMNNAKFLSFGLIITAEGSKFYSQHQLLTETLGNSNSITQVYAGYTGIVYNIKDSLICHSPLMGENIYHSEPIKTNWTLLNESKLIDGNLCYKATNIDRVVNSVGVFEHPVTAWYCPKLPYPYGPNGYGNLPGLILEIQIRHVLYGVKKIDLNTTNTFDTKFLKKATVLNEAAFLKALEKF